MKKSQLQLVIQECIQSVIETALNEEYFEEQALKESSVDDQSHIKNTWDKYDGFTVQTLASNLKLVDPDVVVLVKIGSDKFRLKRIHSIDTSGDRRSIVLNVAANDAINLYN